MGTDINSPKVSLSAERNLTCSFGLAAVDHSLFRYANYRFGRRDQSTSVTSADQVKGYR